MTGTTGVTGGEPVVTVLASGVALGVYVPAQLVVRRLRALGRQARIAVVESLYTDDARRALERHRRAYRADFRIACMAHRLPVDVGASLCAERVDALLAGWQAEGRTAFVVWSGFWLPVLEAYRRRTGFELAIDACRIDARPSTSFRRAGSDALGMREVWLWNGARGRLEHEVAIAAVPAVPFADRAPRLVVHGGGWGLGTYAETAAPLEAAGHALDVVAYDAPPRDGDAGPGRRYFGNASGWSAIPARAEDDPGFPPFDAWGEPGAAVDPVASGDPRAPHHPFLAHAARCRAIVSKPGGGTLMDSLASRTPVVLLEPYGEAERANADIWERLGFGIRFERWQAEGFAVETLARLHENLARRAPAPALYPDAYWTPTSAAEAR